MTSIRFDRLHYLGLFSSPVSWAKVNREFVMALERTGVTMSATPERGLHHEQNFARTPLLEEIFNRDRDADVELSLMYPENLWKMEGTVNLTWILYETDLPDSWVKLYREHCEGFLCPSRFVYAKASEAGLPEEDLLQIPFGVNTDVYRPDVKPINPESEEFVILFVGPQHRRKGIRELLNAYFSAFDEEEGVTLIVKTHPPASENKQYPWEIDVRELVREKGGEHSPNVKIITESYTEKQMASLFRGVDLFVLPSYGEAFGLSVLESMAVGTPVMGTENPALSEWITSENGWLIPGRTVYRKGIAYDNPDACEFVIPHSDRMAEKLRNVYEQPEQIRERREEALRTARGATWERGARKLKRELKKLNGGDS